MSDARWEGQKTRLRVLGSEGRTGFSEKVTYVFRLQQQEAEILVLSKVDLLAGEERRRARALVEQKFPGSEILEVSASTGEGFDVLLARLMGGAAALGPTPDVDYDLYAAGEAALGWLNGVASLRAVTPFAVDAMLLDLAGRLPAPSSAAARSRSPTRSSCSGPQE